MNATPGQSFLQPDSTTSEFNVIQFIVQRMLARVRTVTLVQVQAVTADGQVSSPGFVDVQPLISMLDGANTATPHGTVYNLCYFRLQGGNNAVILDPKKGDVGIAIICDRDISNLKAATEAGPVAPATGRRFDFADGIYLGGVLGLNGDPTQYVRFYDQGMDLVDVNANKIQMDATGITLQSCTGNVIVDNLFISGNILGANGAVFAGDVKTSGNIIAKVGSSPVGLATHTHTQGADSHGDTEQPTSPGTG